MPILDQFRPDQKPPTFDDELFRQMLAQRKASVGNTMRDAPEGFDFADEERQRAAEKRAEQQARISARNIPGKYEGYTVDKDGTARGSWRDDPMVRLKMEADQTKMLLSPEYLALSKSAEFDPGLRQARDQIQKNLGMGGEVPAASTAPAATPATPATPGANTPDYGTIERKVKGGYGTQDDMARLAGRATRGAATRAVMEEQKQALAEDKYGLADTDVQRNFLSHPITTTAHAVGDLVFGGNTSNVDSSGVNEALVRLRPVASALQQLGEAERSGDILPEDATFFRSLILRKISDFKTEDNAPVIDQFLSTYRL